MITTREVESLVKDLSTSPLKPEEREKYLPTKEQMPVIIAFLKASEICRSVKTSVEGIPKRAICIREKFPEIYENVLEWKNKNPEEFDKIYRSIYWYWSKRPW